MANVTVSDSVQASASIQISDTSPLSLASLKSLNFANVPIVSDFSKPMDQFPLDRVAVTVGLTAPSALIGDSGVLGISASTNAAFTLRTHKQETLFDVKDGDSFAPVLQIQEGECWAGIAINVTVSGAAGVTSPSGFGVFVKSGASLALGTFVHFPAPGAQIPAFQDGIRETLKSYSVPFNAAQLRAIPSGIAHTIEASGSVTLGAFYAIPLALNPLATVGTPFNLTLNVDPAVTATVEGSITLEGSFAVRIFRSAETRLVVGLYKKQQTILSATVDAGAGVGVVSTSSDLSDLTTAEIDAPGVQVTASNPDLLTKVLTALVPAASADDFDIDEDQKARLNAGLKECVDRSLSLSVNSCCAASNSDEAAVVYEVDLSRGDAAQTDAALKAALKGDWSHFETLSNATQLRHIVRRLKDRNQKISLNLLGLYNATSIADYLKSTTVLQDENGQISLVDKASAENLSAGVTPYAAKADKLRFALAQAFVATVAYGACTGKAGLTSFSVRQSMLEYHAQANASDLTRQLALARIFFTNLAIDPALDAILKSKAAMSHNKFYLDTQYDLPAVYRLFYADVDQRQAHPAATIDKVGRDTRIALLDPLAINSQARRGALSNDETWNAMNDCGNAAKFNTLPGLSRLPPTALPAIIADWIDIRWWSDAMQGLTPHFTEVLNATAQSTAASPLEDPALVSAHAKLKDALSRLTSKTHSAFGDGWPIAVMYCMATLSPAAGSPVGVEINVSVNGKSQSEQIAKSKSNSA